MISRVESFILEGIDARTCEIEVDLSSAQLPSTTIVGLPDASVKESIQRVRTAVCNSGYRYPRKRVTINLAPATVRKEGPVYDLPIAVALLTASGTIDPTADGGRPQLAEFLIGGELALDGRVRTIKGVISLAELARRRGKRGVIVPLANAAEAAAVDGVEVRGVKKLSEVVGMFNGGFTVEPQPTTDIEAHRSTPAVDFADIRGQEAAKRALTIAAAGGHNILMIGPAGTGKTMMARALAGVLPPLSRAEALEVTRIYSSVGRLSRDRPLVTERPVRTPHHTASAAAIVGGGSIPRPGEVSLAHRGVLFLDELPEFARDVLETLRQPLEEGWVTIARARGSVRFPARFMFVGALNPTPRGEMARDEVSQRAMEKYLAKISRPLIDRIDIHIEVPAVAYKQLTSRRRGTDTATIQKRVLDARKVQCTRQGSLTTNAQLSGRLLDQCVALDEMSLTLLGHAMTELGLSARAYDKIRRVARTIADLDGSQNVASHHISEGVQYRLLDRML